MVVSHLASSVKHQTNRNGPKAVANPKTTTSDYERGWKAALKAVEEIVHRDIDPLVIETQELRDKLCLLRKHRN